MDFILKKHRHSTDLIRIEPCGSLSQIDIEEGVLHYEKLTHLDYLISSQDRRLIFLFGDVVNQDISSAKGIYYTVEVDDNNVVTIRSDLHSLLPLYHLITNDMVYVSSSFSLLAGQLDEKTINPDFSVDLAILYSNMAYDTFIKEIKRVRYGDEIVIDGELKVVNKHRFYDYFVSEPVPIDRCINHVSDSFINNCKEYILDPCAISLTGGFDGRTITGCAHYYGSDYITFSYGKKGNGDVENPLLISKLLGMEYHLVELDEAYVERCFEESALTSLKLSGGISGFQSPHSLHYIKTIGKIRNIIVTGYLGSEILANPKKGNDEVASQSVIDYLLQGISQSNFAFKNLELLKELEILNEDKDILDSLQRLDHYFKELPSNLSRNQMLVTYDFENIVRNTFGMWVYNGMHYARIRVPFLDKVFFNEIAKTELSCFYRKFLEGNPYKRIAGQLLYPNILKKTWTELNDIVSSKGYSPAEVVSFNGRLRIAFRKLFGLNPFIDEHQDNRSRLAGTNHYIERSGYNEDYKRCLDANIVKGLMTESLCEKSLNQIEFRKIILGR